MEFKLSLSAPELEPFHFIKWCKEHLEVVIAMSVVVIYFLAPVVMYPSWYRVGPAWAEMATNYFYYAHSQGLASLLSTDAGYVPLPQRIIALVIELVGVDNSNVMFLYNLIAMLVLSICVALPVFPTFREILGPLWLRASFSASVFMSIDFESRTFINFSYVFILPLVLGLVCLQENFSAKIPKLYWILPLIAFSKPVIVITSVIVGALLLSHFKIRSRSYKQITYVFFVGLSLALLRIGISSTTDTLSGYRGSFSTPEKLEIFFSQTLVSLTSFTGTPASLWNPDSTALAMSCLAFLFAGYFAVRTNHNSHMIYGIGAVLVVVNSFVNAFVLTSLITEGLGIENASNYTNWRYTVLAKIGSLLIFFSIMNAIVQLAQRRSTWLRRVWIKTSVALLSVIVVGNWLTQFNNMIAPFNFPIVGASSWETYADDIDNSQKRTGTGVQCILVDPAPWGWVYGDGCLVKPNGSIDLNSSLPIDEIGPIDLSANADSKVTLDSFAFGIRTLNSEFQESIDLLVIFKSMDKTVEHNVNAKVSKSYTYVQVPIPIELGNQSVTAFVTSSSKDLEILTASQGNSPFIFYLEQNLER
jgi:hypothetical protein